MQLSVVILNYNVRHFLEQCVLSVQSALLHLDAEIIVVDNNSSDDSVAMIKERFPTVKLIQNTENSGFPKGNNVGVAVAQGDYVCILNPDTVVSEDTFVKVLAFAEKQSNCGIVGVKLIDGAGNFLPESKRGVPTPWVAFTKIVGLYRIFPHYKWSKQLFGKYYAQHLNENESGPVSILVGAFMVLKRDLYTELKGFDESCFMYSDDIDLSYRALLAGKSNFYFHETTVIHYKGESTIKDASYMKRFQEAMTFFYQKHFKVSFLFRFLMQVGISFFSFIKMLQGSSADKWQQMQTPDGYILFSKNKMLANKLASILQNNVVFHDITPEKMVFSFTEKSEKQVEIILDSEHMSFKECISFLESARNKGFTFKILPKSANFLIGSNNSNSRGEIIEIV
ncbi:glycosyltransferase family 2 protein [Flavobacterium turcicum]|uniref:Glycosyltransferase family 2 protein n=1 Tax=Flavobacterium turcicum TaxID=2764718 RepID=A0ABR7JFC7_9FLAO|nr:glycosyltransferase family 2 protein [Flavobacterium turcicum]MBC5863204.1 glycosyltransferase family 2 protein [Flavobacterium turcicum]NHL01936.1 glycosyltransferase family 2 protein [Flavobacterium turcicum]